MKLIAVVLCFSLSFYLHGANNYEQVILNQNDNSVKVLSSTDTEIIIEFTIGNYLISPTKINNETFHYVSLQGESFIKQKGNPELPKITKSIAIPGTSDYTGEIISKNYIEVELPIVPSKGILPRTVNPEDIAFTFSDTYTKDAFFPSVNYDFGEPYLIRDVRGANVNFYPFLYNPVKRTLRIYTKLILKISFAGINNINTVQRKAYYRNKYFEPIYKTHFINYQSSDEVLKSTHTVDENGKMLIICYDDFMDEMQNFVTHKNDRGLATEIVSMNTIGYSSLLIGNYIQDKYNYDPSLTFVLLVGDYTQVPSDIYYNGGSDPSYSLVSGTDSYPDIIVGRFSAENESQVETMIDRSINYENMADQAWLHNGVGIACDEGPGDDDEYDDEHIRNIRNDLLESWRYNQVYEFYDGTQGGNDASGDPTSTMISNSINEGISLINYAGHGYQTGWYTSNFTNSNVYSLTNDNMLPFIFSVACQNGNFTNATCFAEAWLRATNNSTGEPTGALGFYGASTDQSWDPPMQAQDEFNKLLIKGDYTTFGALCYNASCSMMDDYGSAGKDEFLVWNIFGDPSIVISPNCTYTYVSETISMDKTYNCAALEIGNTVIQNSADVVFNADNLIINGTFEVGIGSTLEIK